MKTVYLGSDIASLWIDVCVLEDDVAHESRFDNTQDGYLECLKWLEGIPADKYIAVFEPTGRYGEFFAEFISKQPNMEILQANPRKFRQYANSLDPDTKTDQADAFALAMYAKERSHLCSKYHPKTEISKELGDLHMRLRSLGKRKSALTNQLKCGLYSSYVKQSIEAELKMVEAEYERVFEQSRVVLEQDEQLAKDKKLIESIPGIAEKTAILLLTAIDFRRLKTGRAVARFLGLTQRKYESGSCVRGRPRITKAGNADVRAALYFPSMSAMKYNPQMEAFSRRLKANGKSWSLVRTAVARKLVTVAAALIREQKYYNPEQLVA